MISLSLPSCNALVQYKQLAKCMTDCEQGLSKPVTKTPRDLEVGTY